MNTFGTIPPEVGRNYNSEVVRLVRRAARKKKAESSIVKDMIAGYFYVKAAGEKDPVLFGNGNTLHLIEGKMTKAELDSYAADDRWRDSPISVREGFTSFDQFRKAFSNGIITGRWTKERERVN